MDVEYLEGMNGNLWVKRKSWLLKRYGLFVDNVLEKTFCTSFSCSGSIAESRVITSTCIFFNFLFWKQNFTVPISLSLNERRETSVLFVCCKIGKEESVGTPGKGIFPVSCLLGIGWSDKRNCTSTETIETRHALCLKYISGLNPKTGQRSVFYLVNSSAFFFFFL